MDNLTLVKDKESEWGELWSRMDADRELQYLEPYVMRDLYNRTIPDIINVTLNDPAVFAANIIAGLGAASRQTVVVSDDKNIKTAYIEEFQAALLDTANDRLMRGGDFPLDPFFDEQVAIRGRAAYRCLVSMEGDTLVPDIKALDTRYFLYEMGDDGLEWAAPKVTRSRAQIEREYPGESTGRKEAIITDFWDKEINITYIGQRKVMEGPNLYGYVPFGVGVVPSGSMLWDREAIPKRGESIFFLIRDIIKEMNRIASILQTTNLGALKGTKQYHSRDGAMAKDNVPTAEEANALGGLIPVEIGGGISLVPIVDIKQAMFLLHSMLETRMQRGSITDVDLGSLSFPLSAVALVTIGEGRDQVQLPRINTKAQLNQSLANMFTSQVLALGVPSVEIGTKGHKRTFDVSKLEGEYETTYKYFPKSPKVDIARFSMAAAAGNLISDKAKRRDILQREDPLGDERELRWEAVGRMSPMIELYRNILSLVEDGEDLEARLLAAQFKMTVQQVLSGEMAPPEPEESQKPVPLVPLMGGGRSSAKKASDLQQTPQGGE